VTSSAPHWPRPRRRAATSSTLAIRHLAPELLVTSKTQRWIRGLLAHVARSRDHLARREQLCGSTQARGFPVAKTLESSTSPRARSTSDVRLPRQSRVDQGHREPLSRRPAGTGKSHLLVALGHEAVTRVTRCATSQRPLSSRPSTASRRQLVAR